MATSTLSTIFKAYDVRGVVPGDWGVREAYAIGVGLGRFLLAAEAPERVLVARDMRPSGERLAAGVVAGLETLGLGAVDLGLASTDLLYFASGHLSAPGVMLTASHNPSEYNGMKLCLSGARPIGQDTGLGEIRRLAEEALAGAPDGDALETSLAAAHGEPMDLLDAFAEHVRSFVDEKSLRDLRVVADTANGMGGLIAPRVLAGLPFHLEVLYGELDGTFPNHPADPIQVENLADLRARILETGADVGLAFDGDADRMFLVDDKGEPLSGSTTTAMVATAVLERHPGATILHNCICSKAVPEIIEEHGGVPVRTRVGHSFIKARMAETGAVFGGEHSGHYYFRDNYRADSGIIAALVVLELVSRSGTSLSSLRKRFERYAASGEINTRVANPTAVVEQVAAHYGAEGAVTDRLDGLTADLGDWWFNLRPSNTEPLLRLNVEAADATSCARRVAEVTKVVLSAAGPASGDAGPE